MTLSNSTWAGMIAMNLRYRVHCEPCDRIVEIDLQNMPPDGNAIGVTFRCSQCGRPGRSIVAPRSAERAVPRNRSKVNATHAGA
ncbi:Hypothetical protein NGAL_HAMBI1146_59810 [Neorhizobium galegae bv. officinalis]|nr:Hypothetical protein NGAL_HAMBI1146_59810 [Neorhizobium galegae bv. officinalis]